MKKLAVLLLMGLTVFSLSACGSEPVEEATEVTKEAEEVTEDEVSEEPAEAETEEVAEVETENEGTSYFEENGISLSDSVDVSLPFITVFAVDDGSGNYSYEESIPGVSAEKDGLANYSYKVQKSDIDENGNVTYTINSTIELAFTNIFDQDYETASAGAAPGFESEMYVDYYTGQVMPKRELYGDDKYEYSVDIETEDGVYTIQFSRELVSSSYDVSDWYYDGNYAKYDCALNTEYKVEITCPAEYDGMTICLDANGYTEVETDTNSDEYTVVDTENIRHILDADANGKTLNASDVIAIRIADLF